MTVEHWDECFDVIVVGSGAAGLTAALAARAEGAEVIVLESSGKFGGTTAMSGGVAWIPNNPLMAQVNGSDDRARALEYLEALSLGLTERELLETFVDAGPDVVRFLQTETELDFHALHMPDYHPEFPGGNFGRSIMPDVFAASTLGALRPRLRTSPHFPVPISLLDMERAGADGALSDMDAILASDTLVTRIQADVVASGTALAAGLLKAAHDKGIALRSDARVGSLVIDTGVVTGVAVGEGTGVVRIGARKGVVLASGGFERNAELVRSFIRGPLEAPVGATANRGDGLVMAMEAGAALGNMSEAWWIPVMQIPGEDYEGVPFFRLATNERTMPGSIMVNGAGQRFVNEAHNYNDIGRAFHSFDPVKFAFANLPAWMILHQGRLDRAAFLTRFPTDPVPNWLVQAETLRDLAMKIDIDPNALEATVARFNAHAIRGEDPDFHRGESRYDLFHGDPKAQGALKTLGPIDQAPYYAIRVFSGTLGTKGGPRTNVRAQVLNVRGGIIGGLYAAGNAMAGVTGMAYPGAGGTLGLALVFGAIAGRHAAVTSNRF